MTLEELLSNSGTVEFRLRVTQVSNGIVEGYIHPQDIDGGTIDFAVKGNNLIVMQSQPIEETILIETSEDPLDQFRKSA
jgi:hypothetical protein